MENELRPQPKKAVLPAMLDERTHGAMSGPDRTIGASVLIRVKRCAAPASVIPGRIEKTPCAARGGSAPVQGAAETFEGRFGMVENFPTGRGILHWGGSRGLKVPI